MKDMEQMEGGKSVYSDKPYNFKLSTNPIEFWWIAVFLGIILFYLTIVPVLLRIPLSILVFYFLFRYYVVLFFFEDILIVKNPFGLRARYSIDYSDIQYAYFLVPSASYDTSPSGRIKFLKSGKLKSIDFNISGTKPELIRAFLLKKNNQINIKIEKQ